MKARISLVAAALALAAVPALGVISSPAFAFNGNKNTGSGSSHGDKHVHDSKCGHAPTPPNPHPPQPPCPHPTAEPNPGNSAPGNPTRPCKPEKPPKSKH